ncbi:MAG: exo-alpha-sialidase [Rhodocyclaceae bacterium]|nr:exo-alpha-sialidase [Rhodocyclaceae bacterium]
MKENPLRYHFSTAFVLAAALLAAGCTQQGLQKADDSRAGRLTTLAREMPGSSDWTAARDDKGQVWTAWYGPKPALNLTQPDGQQVSLLPLESKEAPSGLELATVGENVWTAYRSKEPVRDVYLQRVGKSERLGPIGVSGDTVALARMKLHVREDGGVDALWYGEKAGMENPYNVFVRSLDAEGKPLDAAPQHVLPGIYPLWINEGGKQGVVSWLADAKSLAVDAQSSVVARTREAAPGAAFGSEVLVRKTTASITLPMDTLTSGKRWLAYWVAQHGENLRDYLIEGGYSDDQGASWQPFEIGSLRGVGIYNMRMAGNGKVVLAAMATQREGSEERGDTELRVVRSTDNGQTWGEAVNLRDAKVAYANVENPKIAFLDESRVVVIWQDWREIRARVRYAYSEDAGETWKVKDGRLPFVADRNMQIYWQADALLADGEGGANIVMEAANDAFKQKDLYRLHLSAADLAQPLPDFWPEEGDLRQRVEEYWNAMRTEDYKKTYAMLDPFFRVKRNFRSYMTDMGSIQYGESKIDEVKVEGYSAYVKETIDAGVRPYFDAYGNLKSEDAKPRELQSVWVWIDGQWHRQYELQRMEGGVEKFTRF